MKKLLTSILIIILVLVAALLFHPVNAEGNWEVSATTNNETITKDIKQVVIQLKLDKYSGDGTLGYQGNLSYDSNIFQSVSINAENDWDDVEYEASTGDFISTTKNAKEGTVIAEIILTLKDGLTSQTTTVSLNDVVFSDAEIETNFNKTFTYTLQYNVQEETNPDTDTPNNDEQDQNTETPEEQKPSEDETPNTDNNQEEQKPNIDNSQNSNDSNNSSNNTETPNTNNSGNTTKPNTNNTQTPNTNTNNTTQTGNTTITVGGATNEDITTAGGKIPQTGGMSTLVLIGIVAVIGIACYIRYRTIQVK